MPTPIKVSGRVIKPGPGVAALNPGLFDSLGRVRSDVGKPQAGPALVKGPADAKRSPRGLAGGGPYFRVAIVVFRLRRADGDNLYGRATKGLRDAIAASLELDDRDDLIEWEYDQVQTRGRTGTLVRIERLR